jgi:hypothetical protein
VVIAIDESGSFPAGSKERHFFAAVHLRQRKTLYKLKQRQFTQWEATLPRSLKNAKGEIKSAGLSDDQLADFARKVMCAAYYVGVTPFSIRPADNPGTVLEKHRAVALIGIKEGVKGYTALGRNGVARTYEDFGNWLKKLNYPHYLKVLILGECLAAAMVNTIGHAVTGGFDEELTRMRFLIDRDFIMEPRHNVFWHELLRNQLYDASKTNPIPLLDKWKKKGHPFLEKYTRNGRLDFNELFGKHLEFVASHEHFEIRIADAVNTVLSRFFNQRRCTSAYRLLCSCFLRDGKVRQLVLNDFDLATYRYDPNDNPWGKMPTPALERTGGETC